MKLFLATFFSLFLLQAYSQQTPASKSDLGLMIGNILDAENASSISAATVKLSKTSDTLFSRMQVTSKDGSFEFDKLSFGLYRLTITSIGFNATTLDSIHVRAERYDFNLGDIKLSKVSAQLEEVVVYAEKPLIENKEGKIVYNVGESALSSGSSTSELLKSMPMIANDPNGKILLKGREPKILIDDKPTELNAQQLADLLESLPGSSIEKIELMTNPPPQYASEAGGVINIVTKKGKIGLVGRVTLSAGTRGEGNLAANVSYRHKQFSFNTTVGIAANQLRGNSYSRRQNFYKDSTNAFNTDGQFHNRNLRPNLRLQGDYDFNLRNSINVVLQSNENYFNNFSFTRYANINRNGDIYKLSTRDNDFTGNGYNHGVTATYTYKGKNIAERLQVIAAGNFGKNNNGRHFYQQFLYADFRPTGTDSTQNQATDDYSNGYSVRVNYDKPLKVKGASITTGASFGRTNNHNILNTSFLKKLEQEFVINDLLSTDFRFNQDILTVRAGMNFNIQKTFRIIAGAQAEETVTNFHFIKGNAADVDNSYWNVLPYLTLRKDFSKAFNSSLMYRSTIRRPGIGELNPSVNYSDPYNIRFGNPYLLPSVAESFDLNIGYVKGKYYLNGSVGFNKVKDIFNTIRTLIESGRTQVTYQNIANRNEYEASIWGGYTFSKKLRVNTSAGYTYNQYGEAEHKLYKYRNGATFYSSLNYNFTPNSVTVLDGNLRYSSFADPQGRARSNLSMNIGLQRKLFNKRLIATINLIDPLRAQKFTTYTYGSNFTLENFNSSNTTNVRLSLAYQLNRSKPKSKVSDKQKKEILDKLKTNKAQKAVKANQTPVSGLE
jgi:ferric enterobactin receptor